MNVQTHSREEEMKRLYLIGGTMGVGKTTVMGRGSHTEGSLGWKGWKAPSCFRSLVFHKWIQHGDR